MRSSTRSSGIVRNIQFIYFIVWTEVFDSFSPSLVFFSLTGPCTKSAECSDVITSPSNGTLIQLVDHNVGVSYVQESLVTNPLLTGLNGLKIRITFC
jgi:hypothetical protein